MPRLAKAHTKATTITIPVSECELIRNWKILGITKNAANAPNGTRAYFIESFT
jgi:hypothetical protein